MRVHVVDPSAYTPPYDDALCGALAALGLDVELFTSRFAYAEAPDAGGYARHESFYRAAARVRSARLRRAVKAFEHVPDMLRYRRAAGAADVVHFQWLTVQQLDGMLLPARPRVITAHDVLPREGSSARREAQRRLYGRFDAVIVHSDHGRSRLVGELGVDPRRVHVVEHGALTHLPAVAPRQAGAEPVVLFCGLLRPYKGIDVLLRAWRGVSGARLRIVGMPRMDTAPLHALADERVQFVERFVSDGELAAELAGAALVVLPYREIDQSGMLFTALAAGRPLLLSDAGGFPELADTGAAVLVPGGDEEALRDALQTLVDDPARRSQMAAAAAVAARERYSWEAIARKTLAVYETLPGVR